MNELAPFVTHWSAEYIGIEWTPHGRTVAGFDCWGLVRAVLLREMGVRTPSFARDYIDPMERAEIAAIVAGETRTDASWIEVSLADAKPFDVAVFGAPAGGLHISIVAMPRRMLHVAAGGTSELAWLDRGKWARRSAAMYRHRELIG